MDRALLFGVKKCLQLGYEGGNFLLYLMIAYSTSLIRTGSLQPTQLEIAQVFRDFSRTYFTFFFKGTT